MRAGFILLRPVVDGQQQRYCKGLGVNVVADRLADNTPCLRVVSCVDRPKIVGRKITVNHPGLVDGVFDSVFRQLNGER